MSLQIASPFQQFFDRDGSPLDNGFVYVGTVNLNPETNPLTVYFDDALTIPAAQPLRTSNGYIVRNGSPARIYTSQEDFSLTVRDKRNVLVFTVADATSISNLQAQLAAGSGSSLVGYNQGGVGAVDRTVQSRLRDFVSVKDFGAVGDGVTDDTAAIQAAVDHATLAYVPLLIPAGTWKLTAGLLASNSIVIEGDGVGVTNLVFDCSSSVNCIEIGPANVFGRLSRVANLSIIIAGTNAVYGIKTPSQADQYEQFDAKLSFENLEIRGATFRVIAEGSSVYYPVTLQTCTAGHLFVGDCKFAQVQNIKINGGFNVFANPSGQTLDRGIVISPTIAALTVRAENLELNALETAMRMTGSAFYSVSKFDFIGCYNGINHVGGSEAQISDGIMNVQRSGIFMNGGFARKITNVDVQRLSGGWAGATNDWLGIDLLSVANAQIIGCKFAPSTVTFGGGFDKYGVRATTSPALIIADCNYDNGLTFGNFLNGVNGFTISSGMISSGTAITYVYLSNNSRYGSIASVAFSTVSVTHTMIGDDGSVSYFDISIDSVDGFNRIMLGSPLVIASGSVTPTRSFHTVDTEGGAATDDLDTITAPSIAAVGAQITLRSASASRVVTVKDGTGNLRIAGDFVLNSTQDYITLMYDQGTWREMSRSDNA